MLRLKELRKQNGETQQTIASLIGMTRGAYANIENGKREPDIDTLLMLANHFNVTTDYIFGLPDKKEKPTPDEGGGLSEEQLEVIRRYDAASPELRAAALAVLRSGEEPGKGQASVSTDK